MYVALIYDDCATARWIIGRRGWRGKGLGKELGWCARGWRGIDDYDPFFAMCAVWAWTTLLRRCGRKRVMAMRTPRQAVVGMAWRARRGGWKDRSGEQLLCCCFSELDLARWVLQSGVVWARTSWVTILADGEFAEFDLAPRRIAVDIDVCDTHCGC
jgi:hypothetical protein